MIGFGEWRLIIDPFGSLELESDSSPRASRSQNGVVFRWLHENAVRVVPVMIVVSAIAIILTDV